MNSICIRGNLRGTSGGDLDKLSDYEGGQAGEQATTCCPGIEWNLYPPDVFKSRLGRCLAWLTWFSQGCSCLEQGAGLGCMRSLSALLACDPKAYETSDHPLHFIDVSMLNPALSV